MHNSIEEIARGLTEAQEAWIRWTPLQEPACAGYIAHWAAKERHRFDTGHSFAHFARHRPELFQRLPGQNGIWAYRLSVLGLALRTHLQSRQP